MSNKKELNAQQDLFLSYLFEGDTDTKDDTMASAIAAGYNPASHAKLIRRLKDEILLRTNERLAMVAPKAVTRIQLALDEDGSTPKGELRLKAAESILDRVGASKKQAIELSTKEESPLFFMPIKEPIRYAEENELESTMTEDDYTDE